MLTSSIHFAWILRLRFGWSHGSLFFFFPSDYAMSLWYNKAELSWGGGRYCFGLGFECLFLLPSEALVTAVGTDRVLYLDGRFQISDYNLCLPCISLQRLACQDKYSCFTGSCPFLSELRLLEWGRTSVSSMFGTICIKYASFYEIQSSIPRAVKGTFI